MDAARHCFVLVMFVVAACQGSLVNTSSGRMSEWIRGLKAQGYDTKMRPTVAATNVSMQVAILAMGPITLLTSSVTSDVLLRHWWNDPQLAYDNETELHFNGDPSELIWVPDTYISNAIQTERHKAFLENYRTKIGPNGNVYVSIRLTIEFSCQMNFRLYPMDTQTCSMDFESYSYTSQELALQWMPGHKTVQFVDGNLQLSGYRVRSVEGTVSKKEYFNSEQFVFLQAIFTIERLFPHYLYFIYIPSILLVVLSWSTFWIPEHAIPARVTLIVTNFLTSMFIFSSAGSTKPQVPYQTPQELFALVNIIYIMLVMVEYVFVLTFPDFSKKQHSVLYGQKRKCQSNKKLAVAMQPHAYHFNEGNDGTKSTEVLNNIHNSTAKDDMIELPQKEAEYSRETHIFDRYSRIAFPFVYAIYITAYFVYYL